MRKTQLKTKVAEELRTAETADRIVIESLPAEIREAAREKLVKIRERQQAQLDDAPEPTLFAAASLGEPLLLTELVRHFDAALAASDGRSPLMAAAMATLFAREDAPDAESATVECLNILLPLSDAHARSFDGRTALMFAGSAHAARILLAVSDPKAIDDRRRTALMHAALGNRPGAAAELLAACDVNAESEESATALDYALGFADDRAKLKIAALLAPLTTMGVDKSLALALAAATSKRADDAAGRNAWRPVIDELASRAGREAAKEAIDRFLALDFPKTSQALAKRSRGQ